MTKTGSNPNQPSSTAFTDVDREHTAQIYTHWFGSFNRWEAGQKLFTRTLLANVDAQKKVSDMSVGAPVVDAVRRTLKDVNADRSLKAYALTMPSIGTVAEEMATIDPEALALAYSFTQRTLALVLRRELEAVYAANTLPLEPFRADQEAIGMRRLKNTCLSYLASIGDDSAANMCISQAAEVKACMTDVLAATSALTTSNSKACCAAREEMLSLFYTRHAKGNDLLLCKWLRIQVNWPKSLLHVCFKSQK